MPRKGQVPSLVAMGEIWYRCMEVEHVGSLDVRRAPEVNGFFPLHLIMQVRQAKLTVLSC